jgi:hypothetical protein
MENDVDIMWYFHTGVLGFEAPKNLEAAYRKEIRLSMLWRIYSFVARLLIGNRKYIFLGDKYKALISGLPADEVLIVGGFKQMRTCFKYGVAFYPANSSRLSILRMLETSTEQAFIEARDESQSEIGKVLKLAGAKVLIVASDSLPMERAWIRAARAGTKSICIQHGLFSAAHATLIDGTVADAILVYDEFQQKLVQVSARDPDAVLVLGYHSDIPLLKNSLRPEGLRKVCILGQPYSQYYPWRREEYLRQVRELAEMLKASNMDFVYKPHPAEMGASYLSEFDFRIVRDDFYSVLESFDVFISLSSTALFEASLNGRIAIQLYNPSFSIERFSELGYAYSIESSDMSSKIKSIADLPAINEMSEKYCQGRVVSRFVALVERLNDIEKA